MNMEIIRSLNKFTLCLIAVAMIACNSSYTYVSPPPSKPSDVQKIAEIPRGDARYKIQFISEQMGWMADELKLWRTSDGGKDWELVHTTNANGQEIRSISFLNSNNGWLFQYDGLYRTDDAGHTWSKLPLPLSYPEGILNVIRFAKDGKKGWAAGGIYHTASKKELTRGYPNNSISADFKAVLHGVVFRTDDSGTTWQEQLTTQENGRITGLYILDEDHLLAWGDAGVFSTENGGKVWNSSNLRKECVGEKPLKPNGTRPVDASFVGVDLGWLSYDNGRIMKTTDGGRNWCDLLQPRDIWPEGTQASFFQKICFTSAQDGWALGLDELLYRSNDGGNTWYKVKNDVRFNDIYFLNPYLGWAITKEKLFRIYP